MVPGRDAAASSSDKPVIYQKDHEPELAPWRVSSWSSASGMVELDVGGTRSALGNFTWADASGRELFVRNAAILLSGRYHLVLVIGPEAQRDQVREFHDHVLGTYRAAK
ncbi:hypothetical protein ACFY8W_02255 [Streptomyces sp. NPDC012637]|uniref:hypothetical protein n=1 Tax=Streptomyces sp. NPDC012637 TaxID=3364842 RepID=UPI0036E8A860